MYAPVRKKTVLDSLLNGSPVEGFQDQHDMIVSSSGPGQRSSGYAVGDFAGYCQGS